MNANAVVVVVVVAVDAGDVHLDNMATVDGWRTAVPSCHQQSFLTLEQGREGGKKRHLRKEKALMSPLDRPTISPSLLSFLGNGGNRKKLEETIL